MRWSWCRLFDVSCGGAHDACSWVTPHHQRSLMQGISKPQHTGTKIDALIHTSHSFSACRVQQNLTLLSWEQDIPKLGHAKSSGDVSSNDFSFGSYGLGQNVSAEAISGHLKRTSPAAQKNSAWKCLALGPLWRNGIFFKWPEISYRNKYVPFVRKWRASLDDVVRLCRVCGSNPNPSPTIKVLYIHVVQVEREVGVAQVWTGWPGTGRGTRHRRNFQVVLLQRMSEC